MKALSTECVSVIFGGLTAIDNVSLEVLPGQRRAILGPNGAGKSTLFNVIGGQLKATSGSVRLFGQDITRLAPHKRAALGVARTFQITNLFPCLTVLQNVALGVQGLDSRKYSMFRPLAKFSHILQRAEGLLERWELRNIRDVAVHNLSYGDQRKIEIVMALAGKPKLLLLDEPTAGLSPTECEVLISVIRDLDPEITVLLIEHDMDVAFKVADWVTILSRGMIVADGTPEDIREQTNLREIYFGSRMLAKNTEVNVP